MGKSINICYFAISINNDNLYFTINMVAQQNNVAIKVNIHFHLIYCICYSYCVTFSVLLDGV